MNTPTIVIESAFAPAQFAAELTAAGISTSAAVVSDNGDLLATVLMIVLALALLGLILYAFYEYSKNQKQQDQERLQVS